MVPRVGMIATVRNRRGEIAGVEPFDGPPQPRMHLVTVEFADGEGAPTQRLLWEREPGAKLEEPGLSRT